MICKTCSSLLSYCSPTCPHRLRDTSSDVCTFRATDSEQVYMRMRNCANPSSRPSPLPPPAAAAAAPLNNELQSQQGFFLSFSLFLLVRFLLGSCRSGTGNVWQQQLCRDVGGERQVGPGGEQRGLGLIGRGFLPHTERTLHGKGTHHAARREGCTGEDLTVKGPTMGCVGGQVWDMEARTLQ